MFRQGVCIVLCVVVLGAVRCDKAKDNDTSSTGRSFGYESPQPRTYYKDPYYDANGLYPEFADTRDRYNYQRPSYPQEIPTGFDQFVPDKNSDAYGPGDFYFANPPRPDTSMQEVEEKNEVTKSPAMSDLSSLLSKLKDFAIRVVRYLFGNNDPDSVLFDERPSILSGLKSLLKDPSVFLSVALVPIGFLLANVIPFLAKMVMRVSLGPAVTSAIASAVARSLEEPAVMEVARVIGELGSRAIEDPRCLQRFLCQAAKSRIESRSGDAWSVQGIVRQLVHTVDQRLWEAMGLKHLFKSLQSGRCDSLPCSRELPYSVSGTPVLDKLGTVLSSFFNQTVTEVM